MALIIPAQDALLDFINRNKGMAPETVVVLRDGVSEGEFETIKREECTAIQKAIDKVWAAVPANYPGSKPLLTFIVVGKRYGSTRLASFLSNVT
jgi:eukaryotic translation initiation factor 2C